MKHEHWIEPDKLADLANRTAAAANANIQPQTPPNHWLKVSMLFQHILWTGITQIVLRLDRLIELRERELGIQADTPEAN